MDCWERYREHTCLISIADYSYVNQEGCEHWGINSASSFQSASLFSDSYHGHGEQAYLLKPSALTVRTFDET